MSEDPSNARENPGGNGESVTPVSAEMSVSVSGSAGRRSAAPRDKEGLVGRTVNEKYRVLEIIARGGMGAVYRAEQLPLGRPVALKLIHSELDEDHPDSEFHKRFFLEAASCAKLTHPNIVVIHDFGRLELTSGRHVPYMAMELLEGRTLHEVIKSDAPLAFGRALRVAREVARALREAHRQDMVHRDLKPTNVMLSRTADGEGVKVLDFGLVKLMRDDSEELTREDLFMGSPKYMAPEQIKREVVDGRADLYALGVLLYQMLSARVPFGGDNQVQTLMAHVNEPVPPMPAEIPENVQAIVLRCLEKDRNARFANADELIAEIDVCLAELGTGESSAAERAAKVQREKETTISRRVGKLGTPTSLPSIPQVEVTAAITETQRTEEPRRSPLLWVGALGLILVGLGVLAAAFVAGSQSGGREATAAAPPTAASPPADPVPPPVAEARPFTVFIDSTPAGAEVFRGAERIGTTPTFSRIDPADLASAGITFRLVLDGHVPYAWTQGASPDDVRISATLEPLLPPDRAEITPAVPSRPRGPRPPRPPSTTTTTMSTDPEDDLRGSR